MNRATRRLIIVGSCLLLALLVTGAFVSVALWMAKFLALDIYLGGAWTFALSLIISSPLLIPMIKKRLSR